MVNSILSKFPHVIFILSILILHAWVFPGGLTYADLTLPLLFLFITFNLIKKNYYREVIVKILLIILWLSYDLTISIVNGYELNIINSIKKMMTYLVFYYFLIYIKNNKILILNPIKKLESVIVILSLLLYFNIALFSDENYEMPSLKPFFDSIDIALVFLLLQGALFSQIINNKTINNLHYIKIILLFIICNICILFSGSRIALGISILMILICTLRKFTYILYLSFAIMVYLIIETMLNINKIVNLPVKAHEIIEILSTFNIFNIIEYITNDSSMMVRYNNISTVFSTSNEVSLLLGHGSNNWRGFLYGENQSLDNSFLVALFDYGIVGILMIFGIILIYLRNFDWVFILPIIILMSIQDIFSNSINVLTILMATVFFVRKNK